MRYTEFQFKNFKGIEDMSLKLNGPVTTLIGLNESGKTTILEAIFCFSYGSEDLELINPELASLRVPDQWIPISRRANFNGTIDISAVVELSDEDRFGLDTYMRKHFGLTMTSLPGEIKVSERHQFENSRFVQTHYIWTLEVAGLKSSQRKPRVYGGSSREWQGAASFLQGRLPRIWYFPNFLFELPERFSLVEQGSDETEEKDRGRFYRSTFEQILHQLGPGTTLETHLIDRLNSTERVDQRNLRALLLGMGNVITKTIYEGWDRIFGTPPTAQEIEIEAGSEGSDPYLELKIRGTDGYYDLSERSLGFRWFFMFLLMTSFQAKSETDDHPLFLLDEPASNLHSTAQAELLKSFHSLVESCDLVYATHSHHLIDVRWLDGAYIVKNAALGSLDLTEYMDQRVGSNTSVAATPYRQFVAKHPDQTSYVQPVLDLLQYRPSVLEPVPEVVLVEGKSDFYLLLYAREVLAIGDDIKLVPGTGAGSLAPLIQLHVAWGKGFIVLLDGDKAGVEEKERYESKFGPVISGKCFLLPEICEDEAVKEVEDVLEAEDRELIVDAVYSASDQAPAPKKALRNAIIELYAKHQAVSLSSVSLERLGLISKRLEQLIHDQKG